MKGAKSVNRASDASAGAPVCDENFYGDAFIRENPVENAPSESTMRSASLESQANELAFGLLVMCRLLCQFDLLPELRAA